MREARVLAMHAGLMALAEVEAGDAAGFSLENGADQLRTVFADVALRRYEDHLVVTEAGPLAAYILSTEQVQATLASLASIEQENRLATLRASIDEQLAASGEIPVTKDSGVFIARWP